MYSFLPSWFEFVCKLFFGFGYLKDIHLDEEDKCKEFFHFKLVIN